MWSLLSKILMGLTVALLVPTGLVLASQNAIPGDATYPIKRALESIIIAAASVNPATRAFFNVDFSERRFSEAVALIKRGDSADQSLQELVTQTEEAATSITEVNNLADKQKLADNLTAQIEEYKKGLTQVEQTAPSNQSNLAAATPTPRAVNANTLPSQPNAGSSGQTTPSTPTRQPGVSQPSQTATAPTTVPTATSAPQPTPSPQISAPTKDSDKIRHTIDELEKIRDRVSHQQSQNNQNLERSNPASSRDEERADQSKENRTKR